MNVPNQQQQVLGAQIEQYNHALGLVPGLLDGNDMSKLNEGKNVNTLLKVSRVSNKLCASGRRVLGSDSQLEMTH
jgi:hypothetical protein